MFCNRGRMTGFSDRWRRLSDEVPQSRVMGKFTSRKPKLPKTPFYAHYKSRSTQARFIQKEAFCLVAFSGPLDCLSLVFRRGRLQLNNRCLQLAEHFS